jgi:ABC-type transport system substrate-binding protein
MIYETLFAWDETLQPKPQMVERWSVSPDGLIPIGAEVDSRRVPNWGRF